jgi:GNAT superfamily N-acetyltransferase
MNVEVLPVEDKKTFKEFLDFPFKLYKGNPLWVPPLIKELKRQFSHENPFFKHAEVLPFIARINGEIVGRIVAIYNEAHIRFYGEDAGFFGFFDCIDKDIVAYALIEKVKQWLKTKGLSLLRGPMNFSSNEEWGLLIEGFDKPPMLMMPYNFPYYPTLLERCGFIKAKDLFAYTIDIPQRLSEKIRRVAEIAKKGEIEVRAINPKSLKEDIVIFKDIYNSAWEKNWGFIPMTDEEIEYMAERLRPLIIPELTLIAQCKGEAVGFMMVLPDYNYVLKRLNGHLFPFGIFKALWYSRKIKDLRLLLLGIKEGYRRRGVDALLFTEGLKAVKGKGYKRVEFSWVLEDNYPVRRLIENAEGKLYKRYRIYETKI